MRTPVSSSFTTLLMLTPLVLIPTLAIFGLPRNRMLDASLSAEGNGSSNAANESPGIGQSAFCDPNDLFSVEVPRDEIVALTGPARPRGSQRWQDPFKDTPGLDTPPARQWTPPDQALTGWDYDAASSSAAGESDNGLIALGSDTPVLDDTRRPPVAPRQQPGPARNPVGIEAKPTGPSLTWQQAVARLNEFGIRHYQLEPGLSGNDFLFRCSYTPANNPRISHRFESEANEPLKAVEKVLQQIEQWQQTQQR